MTELTRAQVTCPRCQGTETREVGKLMIFLLGSAMFGFGIPLSLIFIGIPMIIVGLVLMVIAPFMKHALICKRCRKSWRPDKAASISASRGLNERIRSTKGVELVTPFKEQ